MVEVSLAGPVAGKTWRWAAALACESIVNEKTQFSNSLVKFYQEFLLKAVGVETWSDASPIPIRPDSLEADPITATLVGLSITVLDKVKSRLLKAVEWIDAPVQRQILLALVIMTFHNADGVELVFEDEKIGLQLYPSDSKTRIQVQARVNNHKVDFLLTHDFIVTGEPTMGEADQQITEQIIVQCGGEKAKELDRILLEAGYDIIRFSDQEIEQDAIGCALSVFESMWGKHLPD